MTIDAQGINGEQGAQQPVPPQADPPQEDVNLLSVMLGKLLPMHYGLPASILGAQHHKDIVVCATELSYFAMVFLKPKFLEENGIRRIYNWSSGFVTNVPQDMNKQKQMFLLYQKQLQVMQQQINAQPRIITASESNLTDILRKAKSDGRPR